MFAFMASVPGKLKSIADDITTILGKLSANVDVATSTLAPASSALSSAVWDAALKATIQNRARIKVQTDYVATSTLTSGSGEDTRYVNVSITAVSDTTRCIVEFEGGAATVGATPQGMVQDNVTGASGGVVYKCTARLMSTTQLRISCPAVVNSINGRWRVIDCAATS